MPLPATKKEIQRFLSLANYYRRFVPHFSDRASSLTDSVKGKGKATPHPPVGTQNTQKAFSDIRHALCQNAVLYEPLPNRCFCLYTDASDSGLGAVLTQETPSGEQPMFFLSHKLSKPEQNYTVIEREALAICWAVDQFKYYLWGRHFTVENGPCPFTMD